MPVSELVEVEGQQVLVPASRTAQGHAEEDRLRRRERTEPEAAPGACIGQAALTRVATTGRPASMASRSTIPKPSQREVCAKTFARSSQARGSTRPGNSTES